MTAFQTPMALAAARYTISKDEMIALAIGAAFAELAGRYDGRSEQDGAGGSH